MKSKKPKQESFLELVGIAALTLATFALGFGLILVGNRIYTAPTPADIEALHKKVRDLESRTNIQQAKVEYLWSADDERLRAIIELQIQCNLKERK